MDQLDPSRLINEHFTLLESKRIIERKLYANQTKTAELLAKVGCFEALTVNWGRAKSLWPRFSDLT